MTKIPVGKTIAYAYTFTFGNFLTVLGLSWVSLAIAGVAAFIALPAYFSGLQTMLTTGDPSALFSGFGYMFLFGIVALSAFVMIYVALARHALGLRSGPAFFYFSLDSAFWRLLGAYLLAVLIAIGLMIPVALVVVMAAAAFAATGAFASSLIPIAIFFSVIYLFLRLMFFQPAVAVAEGERIIRRAWVLSGGNFWRIFAVVVAIVAPLLILQFAIQIALLSSLSIEPLAENASPAEAAARLAQIGSQLAAIMPILIPVAVIFYAAFAALIIGASSFAYRSLVPADQRTVADAA